jgi:hypothetical protein
MGVHDHDDGNGYSQDAKLIMETLKKHGEMLEKIQATQSDHRVELALIKQKASIWGAITGCLSAFFMMGAAYIRSKI